MISAAQIKLDEQGNLFDQATREPIQKILVVLVDWTQRLKAA
jgi:hypothetical protein